MRRVREEVAEERTVAWTTARGILSIKLNLRGRKGWPDRAFFLNGGRTFFVEFKAEGEDPRKLQLYIHKQLRGQGHDVEVHDSAEECILAIRLRLRLGKIK